MALTTGDVDYLAELARLRLSDEEKARVTADLDAILEHISKLRSAPVQDVDETLRVGEESNVVRPDVLVPPLPVEVALAQAPESDGHFFKVEAIKES